MSAGLVQLRERTLAIPEAIRAFDPASAALFDPTHPPRAVVATGAGSSLEHARLLTSLLIDAGVAARAVPPSALLGPPGARARGEQLVVFSQGLSPNGRAPLAHAGAWERSMLVTSEDPVAGDAARGEALAGFARAGGEVLRLPVAREAGLLLRVIGPALGALAAIYLSQSAARAAGLEPREPTLGRDTLATAVTDAAARGRALRATIPGDPLAGSLAFLGGAAATRGAGALARKLLEGLLVPLPPVWDLLDFAHGGFQQLFPEHATLLALVGPDAAAEDALLARAEAMLDPTRHRVLRLGARLPGSFVLLEHEALLNELLVAAIAARGIDPSDWPARDRDAPLYALTAPPAHDTAPGASEREPARPQTPRWKGQTS